MKSFSRRLKTIERLFSCRISIRFSNLVCVNQDHITHDYDDNKKFSGLPTNVTESLENDLNVSMKNKFTWLRNKFFLLLEII